MPSAHRFCESLTETPKIPERFIGNYSANLQSSFFPSFCQRIGLQFSILGSWLSEQPHSLGRQRYPFRRVDVEDPPSRMKRMKQIEYRMRIEYKIEQIEYVY